MWRRRPARTSGGCARARLRAQSRASGGTSRIGRRVAVCSGSFLLARWWLTTEHFQRASSSFHRVVRDKFCQSGDFLVCAVCVLCLPCEMPTNQTTDKLTLVVNRITMELEARAPSTSQTTNFTSRTQHAAPSRTRTLSSSTRALAWSRWRTPDQTRTPVTSISTLRRYVFFANKSTRDGRHSRAWWW